VTARPYAADDFTAIRARLEELRRERYPREAAQDGRSVIGPKPYRRAATSAADHQDNRLVPRAFRKFGR
jgi:hypothetical protein